MDRLEAMRLFAAVVEHGSFSEAARREGTTPAQVSKKVAKLEGLLGARLLERTTRSVSLTAAGSAYLERLRSVLAEIETLEDGVRAAHSDPAGALRVSAPVTFGAMRLTPVVLDFLARHPAIEVRLSVNDRMVDLVDEGFDVAVRIGRLEDSSLVARRLAPARLILVARPDHPALAQARRPEDLEKHPCVIDTNYPTPRRWRFRRGDEFGETRTSGRLHVNSADGARQAALAGYGVALTPTFVVSDDVAEGRLVRLLPEWEPEHRDVWAVFPQNRFLAGRVRVFVDHLAEAFGPEPEWDRKIAKALGIE